MSFLSSSLSTTSPHSEHNRVLSDLLANIDIVEMQTINSRIRAVRLVKQRICEVGGKLQLEFVVSAESQSHTEEVPGDKPVYLCDKLAKALAIQGSDIRIRIE